MDLNQQTTQTTSLPKTSIFPSGPVPPALASIPGVAPLAKPWTVIYAIVGVFIMVAGTFVLYFSSVGTKAKMRRIDQGISQVTKELSSEPLASIEREAKQLTGALSGYKKANGEKVNYAKLNEELIKVTPADVKISAFSVDETGLIRLNGTTGNFLGAGKAYLAYKTQSKLFTDVKLENVTFSDNDGVRVINFFILGSLKKANLKESKANNQSIPTSSGSAPVPSPEA